ncbi:MAG: Ltp family lipoprotein [Pseudoramibacter sp.]
MKKPIYKRWWFWVVLVIVLLIIAGSAGGGGSSSKSPKTSSKKVAVADFSTMSEADSVQWGKDHNLTVNTKKQYSSTVAEGGFVSQSVKAGRKVYEGSSVTLVYSKGPKPTAEQRNALAKAKTYSDNMYMSKQAIYDQLTSEYGEQFPADAAQYAVDHLQADYNANALKSAKTYQSDMHMSKQAIYDQLTSSYGDKFTASEAQYAVDHLDN